MPSATIFVMLIRGHKALLDKDICVACFSDINSTSPLPVPIGLVELGDLSLRVRVGESKLMLATFKMAWGDERVDGAAEA